MESHPIKSTAFGKPWIHHHRQALYCLKQERRQVAAPLVTRPEMLEALGSFRRIRATRGEQGRPSGPGAVLAKVVMGAQSLQ